MTLSFVYHNASQQHDVYTSQSPPLGKPSPVPSKIGDVYRPDLILSGWLKLSVQQIIRHWQVVLVIGRDCSNSVFMHRHSRHV